MYCNLVKIIDLMQLAQIFRVKCKPGPVNTKLVECYAKILIVSNIQSNKNNKRVGANCSFQVKQ